MVRKHPKPLALGANYHDGQLLAAEIGPGDELTLSVSLNPVWNEGDERVQRLHLSAIKNFEEVRTFFEDVIVARGDRALAEVICIVHDAEGVVGLDLAPGGYIAVQTRKILEL